MASSTPLRVGTPSEASAPEVGRSTPILIVSPVIAPPPPVVAVAAAAVVLVGAAAAGVSVAAAAAPVVAVAGAGTEVGVASAPQADTNRLTITSNAQIGLDRNNLCILSSSYVRE